MNYRQTISLFLLVALLLAACGNSADFAANEALSVAEAPAAERFETEESAAGMAFQEDAAFDQQSVGQVQPQTRLIIRTADMGIVVKDTAEAMATITRLVDENGGWVVNSSVSQYNEVAKTGNMTLRVPAEGFQSALDAITQMSVEVRWISTSGQDVTEEFVDMSARLANLEATADRVRNFLDETKNVEEALAVNQELSRLEGDIEAMKGRLQYLEQSAAFSTINIDIQPDILSQPLEVGGWQPQGVARSAIEALISALQALVDLLIWLVIFVLPILLLIGIPIWLIVRFIRKRRRARKTAVVEEEDSA